MSAAADSTTTKAAVTATASDANKNEWRKTLHTFLSRFLKWHEVYI